MPIDLDKLEALYISRKFTLGSVPDTVLGLITELRQTRKERDWLAVNLANGLVDSDCIEHLAELGGMSPPDPATLIEAAKEATCLKN